MLKLLQPITVAIALSGALVAVPAIGQTILGPDASACQAGASGPAVLVRIYGFKDRGGQLRVQLYGNNPDDFLAKGKKLHRIDLPMQADGDMVVCVALPSRGEFAVAVRHDRDGNGKSGWNDGGGFSGNPRISFASLKPKLEDSAFTARDGITVVDVVMNYRSGLSIRPVVAVRK